MTIRSFLSNLAKTRCRTGWWSLWLSNQWERCSPPSLPGSQSKWRRDPWSRGSRWCARWSSCGEELRWERWNTPCTSPPLPGGQKDFGDPLSSSPSLPSRFGSARLSQQGAFSVQDHHLSLLHTSTSEHASCQRGLKILSPKPQCFWRRILPWLTPPPNGDLDWSLEQCRLQLLPGCLTIHHWEKIRHLFVIWLCCFLTCNCWKRWTPLNWWDPFWWGRQLRENWRSIHQRVFQEWLGEAGMEGSAWLRGFPQALPGWCSGSTPPAV